MTLGCPGGFSGRPQSFLDRSGLRPGRVASGTHSILGCRSRFGSAFGVILGALALFFGPLRFTRAFQMRSGLHFGTLWTPKSMLPSRREHRFQKISVSAIYLHFGFKIPSKSDLLDAQMALKTRPKRLKSAPRRSWRRFLAVSGGLWQRSWVPLDRFGALRALQGVPLRLFGTIFGRIWDGTGGPCGKGRRHSQRAFVKNDIVSPDKRNKMLCAHAVKLTVRRHRDTYCNHDTG